MMFDSIVVGAGIEGSATACQFAKQRYHTLLLEQFPLQHSRGSSHGFSRILRCAYIQGFLAQMTLDSIPLWRQLEEETKVEILINTGLLIGESGPTYSNYNNYLKAIESVNKAYEKVTGPESYNKLTGAEANQRFPGAVRYEGNYKGYIEKGAGLLKADKALRCFQDQFKKHGGTIHDETCVTEIIPGDIITVRTNRGEYRTKQLVIAAGPWASQMLKPLGLNFPLQCERINVCYWKEKTPGLYNKFPCVMHHAPKWEHLFYGLPSHEYPGLIKLCYYAGVPIADPGDRDECVSREDIEYITDCIQQYMPGLKDKPAIVETCLYTVTPDSVPIIGTHPRYNNLAFVCGLSGTGFKLAPVIGKVMCELVTGKPVSYDMTPFSYKRFNEHTAPPTTTKPKYQSKL